jgi:predicted O-methyltransferase YrrM
MAAPLARLTGRADPAARPLRRALRTALLGQLPREEREWIEGIEAWRRDLGSHRAPTELPELGGGAQGSDGRSGTDQSTTSIGFAATAISLSPHWCVLLMRLVRELRPRSCLERGTGFGISAAYQAAALQINGLGALTTLEGSAAWAALARDGLSGLGLDGVELRVGRIGETLPEEADRYGPVDFVFMDAEHGAEANLEHFETIPPSLSEGAVVVLDDADWPGVRHAHAEIERHGRVSTSVLIGRLGVSIIDRPASASP